MTTEPLPSSDPTIAARLGLIPKCELHLHLAGAVSSATLVDLARQNSVDLPEHESPDDLYDFADFSAFLRMYEFVCASIVTADDFARITRECLARCADSGVRYTELFLSAESHLEHGVSYATMLDGVVAGAADAETDLGIICRLVPAVNRQLGPTRAVEFVEMVLADRRDEVIGIGLDFDEVGHPPEQFVEAFSLARSSGLHRTSHAGEVGPAANVRNGVEFLDCERVDHGYHIVDDPDLMSAYAELGIPFTVCPTTTTYTTIFRDLSDPGHAIRRMAEAGLVLTINSDDPTMFGTTLTDEYVVMHDSMGLSLDLLGQYAKNSIDAAWVDDTTKQDWHRTWDPEIDRILAE